AHILPTFLFSSNAHQNYDVVLRLPHFPNRYDRRDSGADFTFRNHMCQGLTNFHQKKRLQGPACQLPFLWHLQGNVSKFCGDALTALNSGMDKCTGAPANVTIGITQPISVLLDNGVGNQQC
ncbi:hypothetical protein PSTT_07233, partial [Puccinia striiformis]